MVAGPEIELKFLFAESDVAKIKALVAAVSGAGQETLQHLRTIYFDTPNQDLWNHGFAVRVRAIGESHVQTVKRIASSRIERDEWEAQTDRPELDLGSIKNTPLARLAGKASIRRAMRPAFEADVERTSYMLETSAGWIEASLDQGAIEVNQGRRKQIYGEILRYAMEKAYMLPVTTRDNVSLESTKVQDLRFDATGFFPWLYDTWLSP